MDRLRFLEKPDRPLAQAAIQFVISHPAVTAAIPGATKLAQVESNAAAGERGALSEDELARIRAVLKTNG
ncbi:MAG: hypothetical protein D6820_06260 [Lentisphaerae bacterium]|nr:MAG: hypothetical protein D6820_06260 [Lentisphaerota bacterium]